MGRTRTGLFDLEKHFSFYGAYHKNSINIAIHGLFVWPIFFSALVFLYFTPPFFGLPNFQFLLFGNHFVLVWNFGFLVTLVYSVFYASLDLKAGSLAALLCVGCWVCSCFVARQLGWSYAWKVVLVVQLVCWIGQFIGHGVFEKRAPALLDNLMQALVMAPFFVLLEVLYTIFIFFLTLFGIRHESVSDKALQTVFGYEPYPGFHSIVQAKVEANIEEWQESKQRLIS